MILIARKFHRINYKEDKYFEFGEIFKGWYDGDSTVFIENKRTKFTCHYKILDQYFRIFGNIE